MRPAHLHMMVEVRFDTRTIEALLLNPRQAKGFETLVTSFYPEGDEWLSSDAVFGVKKSLVVVRPRLRLVPTINH
jgi:protocatechuate 3,4-dioxygenase beta subunit